LHRNQEEPPRLNATNLLQKNNSYLNQTNNLYHNANLQTDTQVPDYFFQNHLVLFYQKKTAKRKTGSQSGKQECVMEEKSEMTPPAEDVKETVAGKNDERQHSDLEELIRQAEERGYMRAKKEMAAERFNAPAADEEPQPAGTCAQADSNPGFLAREHRSIWDI